MGIEEELGKTNRSILRSLLNDLRGEDTSVTKEEVLVEPSLDDCLVNFDRDPFLVAQDLCGGIVETYKNGSLVGGLRIVDVHAWRYVSEGRENDIPKRSPGTVYSFPTKRNRIGGGVYNIPCVIAGGDTGLVTVEAVYLNKRVGGKDAVFDALVINQKNRKKGELFHMPGKRTFTLVEPENLQRMLTYDVKGRDPNVVKGYRMQLRGFDAASYKR